MLKLHSHSNEPNEIKRHMTSWVLVIVAIILAGGGTFVWLKGFVFVFVGLRVFLRPPTWTVSRLWERASMGLAVVMLLALIPAILVPNGDWRELSIAHGIALPVCVAIHPWELIEGMVFCAAIWAWAAMMIDLRPNPAERYRLLWLFMGAMAILAVTLIACQQAGMKYPFSKSSPVFTYFPNRNQTATVLCMGGVVAFGLLVYSLRHKHWSEAGVLSPSIPIFFLAIVATTSRGGMILFIVGVAWCLYLNFPGMRAKHWLQIGLPVVLILISMWVIFGGNQVQRTFDLFNSTDNYRLSIYKDDLTMIKDHWLTGVGWGDFREVFNFYREHSAVDALILHPESDWLWWVSETGLLGLVIVIVALCALAAGVLPFHSRRHETLRIIPATALLAFSLNTFFDVPAHFLGTIFSAFFLYGIAWDSHTGVPTRFPKIGYRVLGIVLVLMGCVWVLASVFDKPWQTEVARSILQTRLKEAGASQDNSRIINAADAALKDDPFNYSYYIQKAQAEFYAGDSIEKVRADFDLAQFVEPWAYQVSYNIGLFWLPNSDALAYAAFSDALKRHSSNTSGFYKDIVLTMVGKDSFGPYMTKLAAQSPGFRYAYLMYMDDKSFAAAVPALISVDPKMREWTVGQRWDILKRWALLDPKKALSDIDVSPEIVPQSWQLLALCYGGLGQFEKASKLCHERAVAPSIPNVMELRTIDELEHRLETNPDDTWTAAALLQNGVKTKDWKLAQEALDSLMKQKQVPAYAAYWQAEVYYRDGKYEDSWKAWKKFAEQAWQGPEGSGGVSLQR